MPDTGNCKQIHFTDTAQKLSTFNWHILYITYLKTAGYHHTYKKSICTLITRFWGNILNIFPPWIHFSAYKVVTWQNTILSHMVHTKCLIGTFFTITTASNIKVSLDWHKATIMQHPVKIEITRERAFTRIAY